jgi:hypothetical protein
VFHRPGHGHHPIWPFYLMMFASMRHDVELHGHPPNEERSISHRTLLRMTTADAETKTPFLPGSR